MGTDVNPGNLAFQRIAGSNYVDKTDLIRLMNARVDSSDCLVCVSRPRRFGKSYAVKMLTAYYDRSCNSHRLFDDKKIAKSENYEKFLNQYNVICLDISGFISEAKATLRPLVEVPQMIMRALRDDLSLEYPELLECTTLNEALLSCVSLQDGRPVVFIIDEWDAMIREARKDESAQTAYLNLLRGWFKNTNFTPRAVASAYMTGILPIKKDGSQSAISEFDEFTMLDAREFAEYAGFTEKEVKVCCAGARAKFEEMKAWYDGYDFPSVGPV